MNTDDIRRRLEKIESERVRPRMILTTTEVRELLDDLEACEQESVALMSAYNKLQADAE